MATLRKPTEIEPKKTVSILIYGQQGIGKTTLACSAQKAVLFDYDGGVNRIHPAHMIPTLQVDSWEDTNTALDTLNTDSFYKGTRTIIIDTVGKLLDYMSEYIIRQNPKMRKGDGSLSLQGFGVRKKMFQDFIRLLNARNINVIFVAHEREEMNGEDIIKRPLIGGSSAGDLMQEIDLIGYMKTVGRKRMLLFSLNDEYISKNSYYIPDCEIPTVVSADGENATRNDFMDSAIFGAFRAAQERKIEMARRYNEILGEVDGIIAAISDIEGLNAAVGKLKELPVMYDSKIQAGMALNAKARELNSKLEDGVYVAA